MTSLQSVVDYWHAHFVKDGHCLLCGNVGIIDTRATAQTAAGFFCGDVAYCLCPNGMQLRSEVPASVALINYRENINCRVKQGGNSQVIDSLGEQGGGY